MQTISAVSSNVAVRGDSSPCSLWLQRQHSTATRGGTLVTVIGEIMSSIVCCNSFIITPKSLKHNNNYGVL